MRLIDAEALKNKIEEQISSLKRRLLLGQDFICEIKITWFRSLLKIIDNVPTIEAKPIVHAHWENHGSEGALCSNCYGRALYEVDDQEKKTEYCPYCGAKMDEFAGDINVGSKTDHIAEVGKKEGE